MPEARLEKTRRLYDRVIDLGPMGCKILDVGTPDNAALNAVYHKAGNYLNALPFPERSDADVAMIAEANGCDVSEGAHVHARWVFDIVRYEDVCRCGARRAAARTEGPSPWFFPESR